METPVKSSFSTKQFVEGTRVTDLENYSVFVERSKDPLVAKLSHYAIGMCTEVGEFQDAIKKHLAYGKPLDGTNLIEELGDILYYVARAADVLGSSFEEIMEKNNAKLKARYGDKFTEFAALNRNLEAERKILEEEAG